MITFGLAELISCITDNIPRCQRHTQAGNLKRYPAPFLPITVAVALNFIGGVDLSPVSEFHFGILENDLSAQAVGEKAHVR